MTSPKKPSISKTGRSKSKSKSQPIPGMTDRNNASEWSTVKRDKTGKVNDVDVVSSEEQSFQSHVKRFIEISKYFSSPLRKTATYICDTKLVSYPNPFRIGYKRGGVTSHSIKFCNITLQPVYVRLYKIVPDLEQLRFINLSISRCKRIPPGLSFSFGFVFDDFNEKEISEAKMIFVASKKGMTPCYQVCEIDLEIGSMKSRSKVDK